MKTCTSIFLTYILFTLSAYAAEGKIVIKQIIPSKHLAIAEITVPTIVSTKYLLATHNESQCTLKIVRQDSPSVILLDTSECSFENEIRIGNYLESPMVNITTYVEKKSESKVVDVSSEQIAPGTHELGSLMYMPRAGIFSLSLAYNSSELDGDIQYNTQNFYKSSTSSSEVSLGLVYGISERFSIGLNQALELNNDSSTTYGVASTENGTKETRSSDGLDDPSFTMRYQNSYGSHDSSHFAVTFLYSPSLQESKYATTSKNGTSGRGANVFGLMGEIGRIMNRHEYTLGGVISYTGRMERESAADSTQASLTKPRTNFGFGGMYRFIVSKWIDVRGGILILAADSGETQLASGTVYEEDRHLESTVSAGVVFYPTEKDFVFEVGLSSTNVQNYGAKSGSLNLSVENVRGHSINIKMGSQF